MRAYALRRLLLVVPTLLGITLAVFALSHLTPGDPAREQLRRVAPDRPATSAEVVRVRRELGLDRPFAAQYLSWVGKASHGDLGTSSSTRRPVGAELARRIPATLALVVPAALLAVAVALPAGVLAAVRHDRITDHALRLASLVGASIPIFWLGLLLIMLFSVQLGLFPVAGRDGLSSAVLPVMTLTVGLAAVLARFVRAAMLETLSEDYVRTAMAQGLRARTVIGSHALRNCLLPLVTAFGVIVGEIFAGVVVVEAIFAWPGVGRLALDAILQRDYPTLVGVVLYVGVVFAVLNLLTDLTYGVIDPRVRLDRSGGRAA